MLTTKVLGMEAETVIKNQENVNVIGGCQGLTLHELCGKHSEAVYSGNPIKIREASYGILQLDPEVAYYGFEKIRDVEGLRRSRDALIRNDTTAAYYAFKRLSDEEGLEAVRTIMVNRDIDDAHKHFLNCFDIAGLRKVSKRMTLDYYSKRLEDYDAETESPFANGWGDRKISVEEAKKRIGIRFEELTRGLDLADKSILDIGCGLAELYGFLSGKGIFFDYTGVEVNPEMAEKTARLRPGINIINADFMEEDVRGRFDYVFSSGIFCLKTPTCTRDREDILRKQFEIAEIATAASFMDRSKVQKLIDTGGNGYFEQHLNYEDPAEIEIFLKSCGAKKIEIRKDYTLFEFTVVAWK